MDPESAYVVQVNISWEEAVSKGMELREMKDNVQWELGDLAMDVDTAYGLDSIGKFANEIGINKKSLQQYRRVSAAFPNNKRIAYLSHRHHLILAAREDRFDWLQKAADNNWTTTQLYREVAIDEGRHEAVEEKPEVIKCPDCNKWKIESDQVCKCFKLGD